VAQGQDYAAAMAQDMANFDPSEYPVIGELAGQGGVGNTLQGPATINDNDNGTLTADWADDSGSHHMRFTGQGFDVHSDGYSVWTSTGSKDSAHVPLTSYDDSAAALPDGAPGAAPVEVNETVDNSSKFSTLAINGNDGPITSLASIDTYNPADVQLNSPVAILQDFGPGDVQVATSSSPGNNTQAGAAAGTLGSKIATSRAAIMGRGPRVTLKGEEFNFSFYRPAGSRKPLTVPKSGKGYLFRPGEPNNQLRLDYHDFPPERGIEDTWHWNQRSVARIFGNGLDHSTVGATLAGGSVTALRLGGRLFIAYGLYQSYLAVKNSHNPGDEVKRQASGWAGATIGGEAGAELGAGIGGSVGFLFGGVGAVPGAAVGAFVGGIVGGVVGWQGGTWVYNRFSPPVPE